MPVTGVWGGPTPDNLMVVAHMFVEHHTLPNHETVDVRDDGLVNMGAPKSTKRGDFTREVQGTLVMSPEFALILANWLTQKANIAIQGRPPSPPPGQNPE